MNPADGSIYTNYADRTLYDFISLYEATVYTNNFTHYVYFFNSNKVYVKELAVPSTRNAGTYQLPSKSDMLKYDVKYIRFCSTTENEDDIKKEWCTFTKYPLGSYSGLYIKEEYIKLPSFKDSWYKGKKIVTFGDSITEGNTWQPHIANYFQATSIVRGVGGSVVCTPEGMCGDARISTIPSDADLIILAGGANDWSRAYELGQVGKGTFSELIFAEAYELMIKKIVERFPQAKIMAMSLIGGRGRYSDANDITEAGNSKGLVINDYSEMIKRVCCYHGIPCIDIHSEAGINVFNHTTYIGDMVHPNSEGGKLIANAVINGMKRFEPIIF